MEAKAVAKYIRISPRKTRLVVDLVRGKNAMIALGFLEAMNKRAARILVKVLNSAIANARQKEMNVDQLKIGKAFVDGGVIYKRYMPRAMGRATIIKRPTSHITIVLNDETEGTKGKADISKTSRKEEKKLSRFSKLRRKNKNQGEVTKKSKKPKPQKGKNK